MASREEFYTALRNADAAGDVEGAKKLASYIQSMPADVEKTAAPKEEHGLLENMVGGAASGFADVGNTIINAATALPGKVIPSVKQWNDERNASLNQFNSDHNDSTAFNLSRIAGNVAATAPVGGVLGAGAKALGASAPIVNALTTGGMRAGTTPGALNMLTRIGGGAATGGASAALINPEDAGAGVVVGSMLPPALAGAGKVAGVAGRVISGPEVSDGVRNAAAAARESGYVLPPSQVNPSLVNRLTEGLAGKLSTAQQASGKNQAITNKLAARSVGLPEGEPITKEALNQVRSAAGQAYDAVASTGEIVPTKSYSEALDNIVEPYLQAAKGFPNSKASPIISEIDALRSPSFDAQSAVAKIKTLRADADAAYGSGNKDVGKALKQGAEALENAIDAHLTSIGAPPDTLQAFRNARQLIAKTYTIEKGLNGTTGSVNAQALANQLKRGKPLSGDLKSIAETAQAFPSATKEVTTSMPGISPLDFGVGAIGTASGNPLAFLLGPARMGTRAAILSSPLQNRLASNSQGSNAVMNMLTNPSSEQLVYRSAPALSSSR